MSEPATTATQSAPSHFTSPDRPTWDLYSVCIHCGLCLQQCPTYRVLGLEADSPRGRIYQVLQVDSGRLPIGESFVTHIDRCLGCRACETACPSGVEYGRIVERARAEIEQNYPRPWLERTLRSYFFQKVLTDFTRLARLVRLLRLYQRSGLESLLRALGLLKLFGMADVAALAPRIDRDFFFADFGRTFPAEGERRARVAFHGGCIASVAFAELNRATIRVLQKNGVEVVVPAAQACCGALCAHSGFREEARSLARRNLDAFLAHDVDAIVTNAAGCGATLKEYDDLLEPDSSGREKAQQFVARVKDVTEFLAELGPRAVARPLGVRVTYQDPCHLAHGQKIRRAPRALLKALGCELVEMPHSDYCCGSAGVYNVVENDLAMQILDAKITDVAATDADVIATANVGCMLQLRAGVKRHGLKMDVRHVIELLDEAYGNPRPSA
ncbi:MAG TPA: heterodisulfide reductase-related iron-sulfur binding cluster [Terriglobales bacterium]|nr:heterodisulfide reductase-related iron-sulfur binding cluster [Terriglobales bacterium]